MTTIVTLLLDRTGSMASIKRETIMAYNEYINGLRASASEIDYTLVQFDAISTDTVVKHVAPKDAPDLTDDTFVPRGNTNLIDAAYRTIKAVEGYLAGRVWPGDIKVVVAIQTDGEENASTEYTWEQLNGLIVQKQAAGWQFVFMGAGIDAYKQGRKMGIAVGNTVSYAKDEVSTRSSFRSMSANTRDFASGAKMDMSYTAGQKVDAGDKFDPNGPGAGVADPQPTKKPDDAQKVDI